MAPIQDLQADVLVVGGGGAGARAALEASSLGLDTILVCKGPLGKSGCSIFAGNLNWFSAPAEELGQASEEERIRRTLAFFGKYTHYLGDQEYAKKAASFIQRDFYPWLEERGMLVLRDESGNILTDKPLGTQAWIGRHGMSGTIVMDLLRKLVLRSRVRVLEQVGVTRLVVDDGECVGAVAYDIKSGALYAIHADSVVLATGHSNFLSLRSTGTREGAANGWVLAFEAGAKLQNIEIQWYHVSDVAHPNSWMRVHMYPNPMPGTDKRSKLLNSDGEEFFDGGWYPENPVPYLQQLKYLAKEIKKGKATLSGGYFTTYAHVEPEVMERYIMPNEFFKKLGLDYRTESMENAVSWHMNVGGVRVNHETMESDVPGLLVAGSVNALVTGGLPNVMFEGIQAAHTAAGRKGHGRRHPLSPQHVSAEQRRVESLSQPAGVDGIAPAQVKRQIRSLTWQHMNYIKSEASLITALEEFQRIRDVDLPRMGPRTQARHFNYGIVDALDVFDMLQALELEARFSLFRQESRGGFYREDYPFTDNENGPKHTVGVKGPDGKLALQAEAVALPYVRPKPAKEDFFEIDY
jgi:succinate dehydrogenase/fumarate reductase flavoprotein subunit